MTEPYLLAKLRLWWRFYRTNPMLWYREVWKQDEHPSLLLLARHRSTAHATGFAEGVESERARIIAWLRMQEEKGAEIALSHEKGTTTRAAFGGGSLVLSRAADAIQSGEYLADLPEALKPSTDPAKEDEHG